MDDLPLNEGTAVSAIDGRYAKITAPLRNYFSEFALQKNRVWMEVEYLIYLSDHPEITHVRNTEKLEKGELRSLYKHFNEISFNRIKEIEKTTNHDVKSIEYYIRENIQGTPWEDLSESIHFSLTSEDCTNIAYANIVNKTLDDIIEPALVGIVKELMTLTKEYAELPMPARTHGQYASPTTLGKEFGVIGVELSKKLEKIHNYRLPGKLNGATGNHSALKAAYSNIDGMEFSNNFLHILNLEDKVFTTQVDGYVEYSELFNLMKETNTLLKKLDTDMWMYISYDYLVQKPKEGEIGSSTMPHKVNPIQFENSEGNIRIANAIFEGLNELPTTRMQRDLSGSTMLRAMGEAFGHTLIAYENTRKGLKRISPNPVLEKMVRAHPEILAEPIQQVLRREGITGAYELLKEFTRGNAVTVEDFNLFIGDLDGVNPEIKEELRNLLHPEKYVGEAVKLAKSAAQEIETRLNNCNKITTIYC